MIDYVVDAVRDRIFRPMSLPSVPERERLALLDANAGDTLVGVAGVELLPGTTSVVGEEIGGGSARVRHVVTAALAVVGGDANDAQARAGGIVRQVVRALVADPSLGGAQSPDGAEYVERTSLVVVYTEGEDPADSTRGALLTFTVDTAYEP